MILKYVKKFKKLYKVSLEKKDKSNIIYKMIGK